MRFNVSIEARMAASRLPGKVLMKIADKPVLQIMIERVKRAQLIDDVIVATTINPKDDLIVDWCKKNGVKYYRGSEEDVLGRVLEAHQAFKSDIIVELTGDCPLIDPLLIDECIHFYKKNDYDYVYNRMGKKPYPDGMDVQVFSRGILEEVAGKTNDPLDREHVSKYIYTSGEYSTCAIDAPNNLFWEDLGLTLDTKEDFELIKNIVDHFKKDDFTLRDILKFLKQNEHLVDINKHIKRKGLS
jgi:spore coat polysaccharide biosynthesis protein SpsF